MIGTYHITLLVTFLHPLRRPPQFPCLCRNRGPACELSGSNRLLDDNVFRP